MKTMSTLFLTGKIYTSIFEEIRSEHDNISWSRKKKYLVLYKDQLSQLLLM